MHSVKFKRELSDISTGLAAALLSTPLMETKRAPRQEKSLAAMGFNFESASWEESKQPKKRNLYKLLRKRIEHNIQPNVQVEIGNAKFYCQLTVLQCYADYFDGLEERNEKFIRIPEDKVSIQSFAFIYKWMVLDKPKLERKGIVALLSAAMYLKVTELINQCWGYFSNIAFFSEQNAFDLFLEARYYNIPKLKELMLLRICKFFLTLVSSRDFLEMTCEEVSILLNSSFVGVNIETEVFMAAVRWLKYDWSNREQYTTKIMTCVRFTLMSPWILATLNTIKNCEPIERIICRPEIQDMLNVAIGYSITKYQCGLNSDELHKFLDKTKLRPQCTRQFVFDQTYKHHHRYDCNNAEYTTFTDFINHLKMIQRVGISYWRTLKVIDNMDENIRCCLIKR